MHLYCFLDNIKKNCYNYKLPSSGMPTQKRIKSNHKSISICIHVQAAHTSWNLFSICLLQSGQGTSVLPIAPRELQPKATLFLFYIVSIVCIDSRWHLPDA